MSKKKAEKTTEKSNESKLKKLDKRLAKVQLRWYNTQSAEIKAELEEIIDGIKMEIINITEKK